MTATVNRRELEFLLFDLLRAEELTQRPRFAEHDRRTFADAVDTACRIAETHFAPHNRKADVNEPHWDGKTVTMIPEVKAACDAFAHAGFLAAHHDGALGGMQLPWCVTEACFAAFQAANIATAAYPFLTIAAANLLLAHGSQEQHAIYLKPMLDGRFFGTMALSEPQAGSSLADIRTRAEPTDEGHYRITGTKMWISAGEHELSENIVHLVLARIKGAPPGVRGISLFLVPKFLVNADGSLGARNDVRLAGLNHKLGYRGTTNTLLSFGEAGNCVGYLVGEAGRGLDGMFHMMNEARIGVGLGAAMLGHAGYLYALDYARNRPQGRRPDAKDPAAPQVPIIEHADVRRMLLAQKAYTEGAMALCLYAARLVDEQHTHPDDRERKRAGLLLDILTPIVKAWPSEWCLEANKLAIQVLGGYGYTREFPVEQYYRDNRLNMIHEGTNGIQAIDLLGRKVPLANGAALAALGEEIETTIRAAVALPEEARALADALAAARATLVALAAQRQSGGATAYLANASAFLDLLGHTVIAWMWLKQATLAAGRDDAYHRGKLAACRWFCRWELPKVHAWASALQLGDDTTLRLDPAEL
jgi:alkylation response protein AidB-like acyl-CoA dehydrogenase